jgi:hypothetical protein
MNHECPDCGMPERATAVLGFACQHERCPMMSGICRRRADEAKDALRCETWEEREQYLLTLRESEAVKKAMRRFWRRLDEENAKRSPIPT